ncbi:uncharacterized protein NEMAJ01_0801 [Nematocida major]|uniref:uncharacterized protein n=1 Tax=Nematocida major TaxID=1912982 RepID=UPI00200729F6|nr:uncharacterized protein NEMAJ01_0801 [Nematocida major]KAH9385905.1 hypothetical protein NEMAJ01_0801 [Nematocida major]
MVPLMSTHAFREALSALESEIETLSKNASTLEASIGMSRRKNALLAKGVSELKRRKEEQTGLLNREENKIFSSARELSEVEEKVNQMEVELASVHALRASLQEEVGLRSEKIDENELILGLYEGCLSAFK